ncbi:MAG TPA: hypothetical protein VLZ75_15045 [Chitinophagales bacterium]|nr:hypothetical protein [Chitinophagales bacterium]
MGFIFYESFTEPFFKYISKGDFFNGHPDAMVNTFGCYIYIGDIFEYIAIKWNVYLFEMLVLLSISLVFFNTYLLVNESKSKLPIYLKVGLYSLTFIVVSQVESARVTILLSGISTILLFYDSQSTILKKIYYIACIILALSIRIEGGALSIIFISMIYFILSKKSKVQFIKLAIVILPVILFYARVNTPMNLQESKYIQLRPYQFTLWDFNKNQNIVFKSTIDSTIYYTSLNFFLSDKTKMNPEYFKEIGVLKNDKSPTDFLRTINQKKIDTSQLHIDIYKQLLYFTIIVSFLFIVLFSTQKRQAVIIQISGLLTLLAVWILMKMELRVLEPFLLIILLFSIYIGQLQIEKRDHKITILFSLLIIIASALNSFQYYSYQKSIAINMDKTIAYLNDLPENSKIIVNLLPLVYWNNTVLKKDPVLKNKQLLSIDNGLFFLQNNYEKYLIELYGSSEYEIVFKKIAEDNSTYLVSDSKRMNLLSNYAQQVYGIEWKYSIIKKFNISENDIYVYQFNKN